MADAFGDKTEAPTPKRREEARNKGQVAKSQDLPAAAIMLVGLAVLQATGSGIWTRLVAMARTCFALENPLDRQQLMPLVGGVAETAAWIAAPIFIAVFLTALLVSYWQVGFLFTAQPVTPSLSKINPLAGLQRLFSPRTLVMTLLNIAKLVLMVAVVWWSVSGVAGRILYALDMEHTLALAMGSQLVMHVGMRLALAMLLLALIDYAYQRYRHERDLRMTKEEVREELKHMEGDPLMKRRRRETAMKLAAQRLQRDVPQADVVITNPTHLSIALRYRPEEMMAPRVVAKGADWMALRIRQIAALHGVPIVERKPLARAMYDAVEIGQEVPERFYQAIAEILAYVYELSGKPVAAATG